MSGDLTLKVAESFSKDVGRGLARIDPVDMKLLEADVGDIIEITGKRTTVAKLMPAFSEDRGKSIIQIDGIIRGNAQASVGDKVKVRKTTAKIASSITISSNRSTRRDIKYMGKLLDGLPVVKGDAVRVSYFGTRYQEYMVVDTRPEGAVLLHPRTTIQLGKTEDIKPGIRISYEDVGGLGKEIKKIREMIELPLKYPELFDHLGIEPPKGILLYGPPGTGKTLIARAVANETSAFFMHVNGPEIMHKFYGESEAKLREVFAQASNNAPSILFIDEIDVIAPKREKILGDVEKRVVGQLLALMDGLKSRGQVVIIGATNIPNALDPALRRPGRFDREISISIPDRNSRLEILNIHTRGMPLHENVDISRLADVTHGYVGADLAALCREAAMNAIRKIMPGIALESDQIPSETILELKVSMDDFIEALSEIIPSTTREVFVEVPNISWDDIGGLENIKNELKKAVEWPLKYASLFNYTHIKPPKGLLLYGSPGTGKTMIAKAVASESNANFISIKGPELLSKWVGESESGLREIFKKARQAAPCVIFFDEIDSIAPRRGKGGDTQVTERMVSQMLTEMDGIEDLKGVTVLAATNRLDMIDPALLRPGRFDLLIEVPLPDEHELMEIFKVHSRQKPLGKGIDYNILIKQMPGFTGADVASICREAAMIAIQEYIDNKGELEKPDFKIHQRHFEEAINAYRKRHEISGEK
ncbi:MAG: CDC48 family AAA ATPase [Candidatus Methanoperedens sp.]|nr:CDC48 family AAA ATPase [Candidatus Methanoperedens sp.]